MYDLVFHRFPDVFAQDCYDPVAPHLDPSSCEPQKSANIKIIVTDENEKRYPETGAKTSIANMVERFSNSVDENDIKKNELIINGVVKDDDENDVSLTVCIPLRRKGKPCEEFHGEVTLGEFVSNKSNTAEGDDETAASPDAVTENGSLAADSGESALLPSCDNVEPDDSDDDVHSDASSVDFWKEIVDNEDDLFYRNMRDRSDERLTTEASDPRDQSAPASVPRNQSSAASRRVQWHIGDDVRHYCPYTFLSDSSNDSSSSSSSDPKAVRENEAVGGSDNTCSTESETSTSGENGYCDVYEFSKMPAYAKSERPGSAACDSRDTEVPANDEKSPSDSSDAEEDSGLNSDAGQNNSETDADGELRKSTPGLNTHSRLYKLLLAEQKRRSESANENDSLSRKGSLTLPLNSSLSLAESGSSSSGINSPISLGNDRLISHELLQSVLKGRGKDKLDRQWRSWLREMAVKSIQAENADRSRGSSRSSPYFNEEMWKERSQTDSPSSMISNSDFQELMNEFDAVFRGAPCDRSSPATLPPPSPLLSQIDSGNPLSKCDKSQDGCYKR